jgi:hypothetical protein
MPRFSNVEEFKCTPGEYLMKIYEAEEKTSQSGNQYIMVKFESNEGVKICDSFMLFGSMANKTLQLLKAVGLMQDGQKWEEIDFETDDLLGQYLYIDAIKDKDNPQFLKTKFDGFRPYEKNSTPAASPASVKPKQDLIGDEEVPF